MFGEKTLMLRGEETENLGEVKWQPTPVLLPGESHGGRSLVGYSPWGRKESDMTERLQTDLYLQPQKFPLSFRTRCPLDIPFE